MLEFHVHSKPNGWTFARDVNADVSSIPSLSELYRKAMNNRDVKRELYEKALNAAFENIMSWERMARADGFRVKVVTDKNDGEPTPVYEGNTVKFVQSYGVVVEDAE